MALDTAAGVLDEVGTDVDAFSDSLVVACVPVGAGVGVLPAAG